MHLRTTTATGVDVSTIELSPLFAGGSRFETCLFFPNGDSEVVDTYTTKESAKEGHKKQVERHS